MLTGPVRGQQRTIGEGLRRLRPPQPGTRGRGVGHPIRLAPQRIDHRLGGDGALAGSGVERGAGEGPGGVVDQNDLGVPARQCLQRKAHGVGTFRATIDRRQQARIGQRCHRRRIHIRRIRVDRHQHRIEIGTGKHGTQCPRQHHLTTDLLILLRNRATQAHTPAGGDNDGGCSLGTLTPFIRVLEPGLEPHKG